MSNNKQQTAVEWLMDNVYIDPNPELYAKFQLAKEMEKQQITKAWKAGDGKHDKVADELAEQWYEKTYGGNK
jgi:hypothetical protein